MHCEPLTLLFAWSGNEHNRPSGVLAKWQTEDHGFNSHPRLYSADVT